MNITPASSDINISIPQNERTNAAKIKELMPEGEFTGLSANVRVDSAYKDGALSEDDYKQLCTELENYTDEAVYNVEYKRCAKIARQDNPLNVIGIYSKETLTDTRHQVLEMMKKAREVPQPWQVDRDDLMKMIMGIRYGVTEI